MTETWDLLARAAQQLQHHIGERSDAVQGDDELIRELWAAAERLRTQEDKPAAKPATYGVYFFKGNGQVVPATRSQYAPVALGIACMTDAVAVRDGFRLLHPQRHWIACDERFQNVLYGFRTATAEEINEHWVREQARAHYLP